MNDTKTELYTKIKINKPTNQIYMIDQILAEQGIPALWLPPYHLNPIEKIWATVKIMWHTTFKLDDMWQLAPKSRRWRKNIS